MPSECKLQHLLFLHFNWRFLTLGSAHSGYNLLTGHRRFLWVTFQLYDLKEALTKESIRTTLQNLPKSLGETYLGIIRRVHRSPSGDEKIDTMRRVFRWILAARRPLQIEELEEAVALDQNDTHLRMDQVLAGESLLGACKNLVAYNEINNSVTFAHYTIAQYLLSDGASCQLKEFMDLTTSADDVGDLCIVYLSFPEFQTQIAKLPPVQPQIDQRMVDEMVWSSLPLGSHIRNVISWGPFWRKSAKSRESKAIPLARPVSEGASESLSRKYTLLEYITENWPYHTTHIRPAHPHWDSFVHVALYLELSFEHRPWHAAYHLVDVYDIFRPFWLHSLSKVREGALYVWAFRHALGSFLALTNPRFFSRYLGRSEAEVIPEGLKSGWVTSDHVLHLLRNFPAGTSQNVAAISTQKSKLGWDEFIMLQLLAASQERDNGEQLEPLYDWLTFEFGRLLSDEQWDHLIFDTCLLALHNNRLDLFEWLRTRLSESIQTSKDKAATSNLHETLILEYLRRFPSQGLDDRPFWDLIFSFLANYHPSKTSQFYTMVALTKAPQIKADSTAGQLLLAVALISGSAIVDLTHIFELISTAQATVFTLDDNWTRALSRIPHLRRRVESLYGVHVLDLVKWLSLLGPLLRVDKTETSKTLTDKVRHGQGGRVFFNDDTSWRKDPPYKAQFQFQVCVVSGKYYCLWSFSGPSFAVRAFDAPAIINLGPVPISAVHAAQRLIDNRSSLAVCKEVWGVVSLLASGLIRHS